MLYVAIFFIALLFRLYDFYDTVGFRADPSRDLYIARIAAEDGTPLYFGPQLSVKNFNIPPTYYYLLAILYRHMRTPEGVAFVFVCMNILAMICMVRLAHLLIGKEAGLIMAALFSISSIMVSQSRMAWQPYPLTLAISFSLLMIYESFKRKSLLLFYGSFLAYTFSLSVYLSPILLAPYYFFTGIRFFKKIYSYSFIVAFVATVAFFVLAIIPFFGQYALYEKNLGYPSFTALQSSSFGLASSYQKGYEMYMKYITDYLEDVFHFDFVWQVKQVGLRIFFQWMVVLLLIIPKVFKKYYVGEFEKIFHSVKDFLGFQWLIIGSCIILWFQKSVFTYRVHIFTPFFFIGFVFILFLAFRSRRNIFSFCMVVICVVYIIGNISHVRATLAQGPHKEAERAVRAAMVIGSDSARSGIIRSAMAVGVSYNYPLAPFLYYLRDIAHYSLPYVPERNTINVEEVMYPNAHSFFYLICIQHGSTEVLLKECEDDFVKWNPGYIKLNVFPINDQDNVIKFMKRPI